MRNRSLLLSAVLLVALAGALPAADVTGKWKANFEGPMGAVEITFNFQVKGAELTGTVSSPMGGENQIQEGKVNGDEIAFLVVVGGGEFKISYKGKQAGDDLKLTASFGAGDMPPMEMTAKRVK